MSNSSGILLPAFDDWLGWGLDKYEVEVGMNVFLVSWMVY